MKRWILLFFLGITALGGFAFWPQKQRQELPFISFDLSMSKANSHFEKCYTGKKQRHKQWVLFKKLYDQYRHSSYSEKPRIPKIIHQIWLGSPFPQKYLAWQKSWQEKHPDWEYRLWTDADAKVFPFINRKRFDEAVNVGEKADIFRYEILNQFGGLYVDTDFACVQPFDIFHHTCDFYTGLEAALEENSVVALANGLIGAAPGHPIIKSCIEHISKLSSGKDPGSVLKISGPGCLKRAFIKCCQKGNYRNVAFPYTYFYPIPAQHFAKGTKPSDWIQPETYGVHYWETSWANKGFAE